MWFYVKIVKVGVLSLTCDFFSLSEAQLCAHGKSFLASPTGMQDPVCQREVLH